GMGATNQMTPISAPFDQSNTASGPKFFRHVPRLICKPTNQSRSDAVAPQKTGIQLAKVENTGLAPNFWASSPARLVNVNPRFAQELSTPDAAHTSMATPNPRRCPASP